MRPKPELLEKARARVARDMVGDPLFTALYEELVRLDGEARVTSLEERQAWDRYAASGLAQGTAAFADRLLAERRKRFGDVP